MIWDEIQRILEKYPEGTPIHDDLYAWDDAYRCERLLVNLYDPARLDIELQRRILAAETTKLDYANFYSGLQAKPIPPKSTLEIPEVEFNRALLAKLIDDQQWHDTKRYLKRSYANDAQIRVFRVFSVALVLFILVMLVVFLSRDQLAIPAKSGRSTQSQATPPASSQEKPAEPATGGGTGGPIVAPTAGALEPPASKPEGASDAPPVQMQD